MSITDGCMFCQVYPKHSFAFPNIIAKGCYMDRTNKLIQSVRYQLTSNPAPAIRHRRLLLASAPTTPTHITPSVPPAPAPCSSSGGNCPASPDAQRGCWHLSEKVGMWAKEKPPPISERGFFGWICRECYDGVTVILPPVGASW